MFLPAQLSSNLIYTEACNKNWTTLQSVLNQMYATINYIVSALKLGGKTQGTMPCLKRWQGKSKWIISCLKTWMLVLGTWPVIYKLWLFWLKRGKLAKRKALFPISFILFLLSANMISANLKSFDLLCSATCVRTRICFMWGRRYWMPWRAVYTITNMTYTCF